MQSVNLEHLAIELLNAARSASSGRAGRSIHADHHFSLRQTVIALLEGQALAEHESPGEATLQVLSGEVRLGTATDSWHGRTGDYLIIPPERHDLTALGDAVVLLSVAAHPQ
ncbi:cupin domain-containing protein [Nocardioides dubius]|uniref:Cupin domain-containing protein n=1 Tax=Nocardioides dubius TaxID=317019 RepID=A0ABP4ELF2_9ACTN